MRLIKSVGLVILTVALIGWDTQYEYFCSDVVVILGLTGFIVCSIHFFNREKPEGADE